MKRISALLVAALATSVTVSVAPAAATWAGDRGAIAFHSFVQPKHDIFAMNPDGTYATNLTRTPGLWEFNPAYSPDGTRIAYERSKGSRSDIWVMNADGSGPAAVVVSTQDERSPTWSPDGSRIAFTRTNFNTGATDLFVVDAAGGPVDRLTTSGEVAYGRIAWHPNGESIVVSILGDQTYEFGTQLASIDVASKQVTLLTTAVGVDHFDPDFSPDGSKIVFVGTDLVTYLYRPYVINADGTGKTLLTGDFDHASTPVWSPDGGLVAFSSFRSNGAPVIALYSSDGSPVGTLPMEGFGLSWQACAGDCTLSTRAPSDVILFSYTGRKKTTIWASIAPTHVTTDIKITVSRRKDGRWRRVLSETKSTGLNGLATLRYPRISKGRCKAVAKWAGDTDHFGAKNKITYRCGAIGGGEG